MEEKDKKIKQKDEKIKKLIEDNDQLETYKDSHVIKYGTVKYFMKVENILSRRAFYVISYSTMRIHMFLGNLVYNIYNI